MCAAGVVLIASAVALTSEDMQVRNFALNTRLSYLQQVSLFARYFCKSPDLLGGEDIRTYQVYLVNEKKPAGAHCCHCLSEQGTRHSGRPVTKLQH